MSESVKWVKNEKAKDKSEKASIDLFSQDNEIIINLI